MNHFAKLKSANSHVRTRVPNDELLRRARRKLLALGLLGVLLIVAGLLVLFTGSGGPNTSLSQVRPQTTSLPALVRRLQAQ